MHDLVRLCSAELAAEHDSPANCRAAQARVIGYYADAVSEATVWFNSTVEEGEFATRTHAMEWLLREGPTAVAAAHLAEASDDHDGLWRLGMNLQPYLNLRHDFGTSLALLESARSSAAARGDAEDEAGALNNIGLTLTSLGRLDEAATRFREGLAAARGAKCLKEEASLLVSFAALRRRQAGPRGGFPLLEQAAEICRRIGDHRGLAFVLTNLGISLREGGAFKQAIPVLREALRLHRESGARQAEGSTLTHLATALSQTGDVEQALPLFAAAIAAAREVHDMSGLAGVFMNLGLAQRSVGRLPAAVEAFGLALTALDANDDIAVRWAVHVNLSLAWRDLGDEDAAQGHEDIARELRAVLGGPDASLDYLPSWVVLTDGN